MESNAELLKRAYRILPGNPLFAAKLYLSLAHTDADIDRTLEAVEDALRGIGGRR